ncbi:MAG: LPS assembly lipoprotein LptE [Alphaproteobacteria bacterium]
MRALLVVALLGLAACGFEPLYGDQEQGTPTEDLLSRVSVPPLADRLGQLVRIELTNRLNPRPAPEPFYVVSVQLNESKQGLAVRRDASATRANLIITATFALTPVGKDESLLSGDIRSSNGYDILTSDFATLAAENDARRRGARDIADAIVDRLAIYLSRQNIQAAAPASR